MAMSDQELEQLARRTGFKADLEHEWDNDGACHLCGEAEAAVNGSEYCGEKLDAVLIGFGRLVRSKTLGQEIVKEDM